MDTTDRLPADEVGAGSDIGVPVPNAKGSGEFDVVDWVVTVPLDKFALVLEKFAPGFSITILAKLLWSSSLMRTGDRLEQATPSAFCS
jgi:hypothetical protein